MEISKKSRVWIYQSDRPFLANEEHLITQKLSSFISQWEAHGSKLTAKAEIRYNRFIILMVDEAQAGATGCSIDKSVNLMKQVEQELNVNLFDRFNIAYRDGDEIKSCSRDDFEQLISDKKITQETIVFNNMVATLEELESAWEVPLKNSWHVRIFGDLINA
jgi:hypothetical protein